jgi:hypothetical protein
VASSLKRVKWTRAWYRCCVPKNAHPLAPATAGSSNREVRMRAKNNAILPHELARKISPWIVNSAEMSGAIGKTALTGFAACFLCGPVWIADRNGFLYLLGPWVCPSLIALLMSATLAKLPFRIYRGSPFAERHFVDTGDDPVVMRLSALCNSDEARGHLWRETLKLSIILFAILWAATILLRDSLNWIPHPRRISFSSTERQVNREAGFGSVR